jgi:(+)-abscisic acid 8'-hydroxylase
MAFFLALVCILVFLAIASYVQYTRWQKGKGRFGGHGRSAPLKLPPGSMGWPYLGETLQLYSQDPSFFFASKQKRLVAVGNYYYSCGQRVSSFVLDPPPCSQAAND